MDRIAQLEAEIAALQALAAHWEHKYTRARQYNRNLEERIKQLEKQESQD